MNNPTGGEQRNVPTPRTMCINVPPPTLSPCGCGYNSVVTVVPIATRPHELEWIFQSLTVDNVSGFDLGFNSSPGLPHVPQESVLNEYQKVILSFHLSPSENNDERWAFADEGILLNDFDVHRDVKMDHWLSPNRDTLNLAFFDIAGQYGETPSKWPMGQFTFRLIATRFKIRPDAAVERAVFVSQDPSIAVGRGTPPQRPD